MNKLIIVPLFVLLALPVLIYAQASEQIKITIVDAETNKPVEMAHVCITPFSNSKMAYDTSNHDGEVVLPFSSPGQLTVSFMGYQTYNDTITRAGQHKVSLQPCQFRIEDVVVTGHAAPVRSDRSIYKINVLDLEKEKGRGANDLYQLLSTESNIRLQQDLQLGGKIVMQGLPGQYVKVLIDGVPVTGRMDGNIDLSQIDMNNVDHIELIEGPLSVIYGSGALAGTINIITKERKKNGLESNVNTYGESVGIINGDASLRIKNNNHGFGFSGMGYHFNGWDDVDSTSRSKKWKPKTKYNVGSYYMYTRKHLKLKAAGNFFNEKLTAKGEPMGFYNDQAFDSYFHTRRADGRLEGSHFIKDRYKVDVMVAYNYYRRVSDTYFLDFREGSKTNTKSDTTRFDQFASRMIYATDAKSKLNASLGYDINLEKGFGERIEDKEQSISDYAGFINLNYQPWQSFQIQPGLRVIHNSRYDAPLTYSLNVLATPATNWQTRLSFAKSFKSPDLKQLYHQFVDSNHDIRGNPDLQAEDSYNFNFNSNYKILKEKVLYAFTLRAFYNEIHNKIEFAPIGAIDGTWTYININEMRTQGIGGDFKFRHHPLYSFSVGWTTTGIWQKTQEDTPFENDYSWYTDISSTFNLYLKKYFDLSVYYKYNGSVPQIRITDITDNSVKKTTQDAYHTLDISLSRSFIKNRLSLVAGVKNLLDVTDVNQTSVNSGAGGHSGGSGNSFAVGYGRSYFIKLSYQLFKN
ncbi:TonB-dependent receptor [Marinilabiliaceae bacterium JC017]|nr:TonB-dependent receptor [Marinilabiliaceae bacterium JC017]